jgi:hypothetical protein
MTTASIKVLFHIISTDQNLYGTTSLRLDLKEIKQSRVIVEMNNRKLFSMKRIGEVT